MPKHINTFSGGLDRDTVPTSYKNTNYYNAKNFNIVVAEDLSSATLTNTKGVTVKITDYNSSASRTIVGLSEINSSMVVFVKGSGTNGRIHVIPFSVIEAVTTTPINLNDGTYLLVSNDFDFGNNIEIVAREETPLIKKLYWVDGVNPLRYCNIMLGATVLSGYTLDQFEVYQNVTFSTPTFSKLISGSLKCGMYQYSYCLYNQNANQTSYSPPSGFIQISSTGLTTLPTYFQGGDIGEVSPNGIQIAISDTNTDYSFIRVVALYYSSQGAVPEVTIIYEGAKMSSMIITHTGSELLGTITAEDVVASPNILIPKTLTSKFNYLFVGNVQESTFDVEYDARAYRFNSTGTCRMYLDSTDYSSAAKYIEFSRPTIYYGLNVINTNGVISKNPDLASYIEGSSVVLTAVPNYRYLFRKYTVNGMDSYSNPLTLVMNGEKTVEATYTYLAPTYSLTISSPNGTVVATPSETLYYNNQSVSLAATPNIGYGFVKFTKGGVDYLSNPLAFSMTENTSVTAVFAIDPPVISTNSVTGQSVYGFTCGGNVTYEGTSPVTEKGICYNTTGNPTISDTCSTGGTGLGAFSIDVTGLVSNTLYYIRAYTKYLGGTVYGSEVFAITVEETVTPRPPYVTFSPMGYPCVSNKFKATSNFSGWSMSASDPWILITSPSEGYDHNGPLGETYIQVAIDVDNYPPVELGREGTINIYNTSDVLIAQVDIAHLGIGESCP